MNQQTRTDHKPPSLTRPTWATIDLDALVFNLRSIKTFIGNALPVMAVVKANCYGHGAVECARRLSSEGVDWFGVAMPEEGVELRDAGITNPILCFGNWPGQEGMMRENALTPVVYQIDRIAGFNAAAKSENRTQPIHIKIDTGMGRIGVRPENLSQFISDLKAFDSIEVEGLMTHFACADEVISPFTDEQMRLFSHSVDLFLAEGFRPKYLDMANSPGAVVHPESLGSMVRIGGLLYGLGGDVLPKGFSGPELRPVMSLRSSISYLKEVPAGTTIGYGATFVAERSSKIATIPIGYHDGLPRSLSNKGSMLVNGILCPIVGRVSMDWTTIDVTGVENVSVGSEVILIGVQGDQRITAEEMAEWAETISYEVTCGIAGRVPRIYKENGETD